MHAKCLQHILAHRKAVFSTVLFNSHYVSIISDYIKKVHNKVIKTIPSFNSG